MSGPSPDHCRSVAFSRPYERFLLSELIASSWGSSELDRASPSSSSPRSSVSESSRGVFLSPSASNSEMSSDWEVMVSDFPSQENVPRYNESVGLPREWEASLICYLMRYRVFHRRGELTGHMLIRPWNNNHRPPLCIYGVIRDKKLWATWEKPTIASRKEKNITNNEPSLSLYIDNKVAKVGGYNNLCHRLQHCAHVRVRTMLLCFSLFSPSRSKCTKFVILTARAWQKGPYRMVTSKSSPTRTANASTSSYISLSHPMGARAREVQQLKDLVGILWAFDEGFSSIGHRPVTNPHRRRFQLHAG